MSFPSISPKQSFPALESEVLAFWKANNTFQKSIDSRPMNNPYRFYDGPPFITGMPHYGHMLSSAVKDAVGRYWTMRGHRVERTWGWDCHGLPIEERVQKKLGLKSNKEIEAAGVKNFIDECYNYTSEVSSEWNWYIDKIGRWVDMDNAYRTMDQDYMESVMWVFSQLWNKGLIYEGKRVSLYSWKLGTPISNFEVAMDDTYQEVNDPAITVKFALEPNDKFPEGTKILAWTTTPWTIPANMALAVRNDIDYVLIKHSDEYWDGKLHFGSRGLPELKPDGSAVLIENIDTHLIVAKNRVENIFTKSLGEYRIIGESFKGSELVGLGYVPPFPEYYYGKNGDKNHKIYHADFITDTDGTGIGHEAPEFGEVDFQLAKKEGIHISNAMDEAGKYTSEIFDYEGTHYLDLENPEKGANKINIERMKANNTLFKLEGITHRVPFCPRSGTPLVQKAQASWFIDIQSQKDKLIEANEQINWFPEYLKEGRFKKGIETAPDWCISRTRYWGAPMPVWMDSNGEKIVVSSRDEIFELNKPYGQLTKLIITRHAQSQANVDKHYDDIGTSPLSEKGREQAEKMMQELKNQGIDIIITSPFLRAIQTAEPLAKELGIEITTDIRLKETDHGNMANAQSSPEVKAEREITFFGKDKDHKFAEIGESYNEVLARTTAVIDEICEKYPGKTVLVVSHGFPIGVMSAYLKNKPIQKTVENATLEKFIIDVANKTQLNLHKPYIDNILLAPKSLKEEKITKVIVTRHAESEANVNRIYDDIGTSPLSEKGSRQAESFVEQLKNEGVDIIITSPFLRAIQTAEPLAKALGIKIITDERLKETDHGKFTNGNLEDTDVKSEIDTFLEKVFSGEDRDYKFGETGESYNDIKIRMQQVIDHISEQYSGKTIFIVSHGYPTRIIGEILTNKKDPNLIQNAKTKTYTLDVANKTQKTTKVIFIRHRDSEHNIKHIQDCSNKSDLTEKGRQDAITLTEQLKGIKIDAFYSSPFDRCLNTIKNLAEINNTTIVTDARIQEIQTGTWDGKTIIHEDKFDDEKIGGAESQIDCHNRVTEFLKEVVSKNPGKTIVICSHGDPLLHMKKFLRDFDFDNKEERQKVYPSREKYEIEYIVSDSCKIINPLTRIPEVLDVWMDSGSMPYAQMHYPFENTDSMKSSFPADFITEYVGQIRAWFYVMHVLGVLLGSSLLKGSTRDSGGGISLSENQKILSPTDSSFQKEPSKPTPSFTNVITTGVINGNDGRKMSKSFGNYPDPRMAIEKYGADPIRFYMINSPLLSGGDMDFKEEGIMETIKGVMLPIWNTYSFFTTYANIDAWEHDDTEVWFARHAESESNLILKMSDGSDDPQITEKGREQAKNAGKTLASQGKNFDIIIHTDRIRTHDTARIIAEQIGFHGEYIIDDGFAEQTAGEYANKTLTEIAQMANLGTDASPIELRKIYKNNSVENIAQFEARILKTYENILIKYKGKRILIVAHAGTPRPILHKYMGMDQNQAYYDTNILNADPFRLLTSPIANPLDSWILSKLQVLMAQVHDAMEAYDISRGCRAIVDYMDELTNWYVRLSRRRFWESGMTDDKRSAYETLYTVLTEVSKLMAPLMPFLSESIYQGLTSRESVHLEYVTFSNKHLIANDLNRDMEVCEHIVSLGLALRSRKNIRVRQPLASVTITQELDVYYQMIIRDELNVKEVRYENPENLAKKICKPDARKIGPKYGKNVQKVITEAKNGNFTEKENGILDVGGFILELGEYTIEYLPTEGTLDVEGGYGMVVGLDTHITESLKFEGYARDIVRLIQDMRKEADYAVTDRIFLEISGKGSEAIVSSFGEMITNETLSNFGTIVTPDIQKTESIDENIQITLKVSR